MGADDLENRLSIDNYFYGSLYVKFYYYIGYIATDGELAVSSQLVRSLDEVKVVMYNDRVSVSHRDTVEMKRLMKSSLLQKQRKKRS